MEQELIVLQSKYSVLHEFCNNGETEDKMHCFEYTDHQQTVLGSVSSHGNIWTWNRWLGLCAYL